MATTAKKFWIEIKYGSEWEPLPSDNEFSTRDEAEKFIENDLRKLGTGWADGEYRVTKIEHLSR